MDRKPYLGIIDDAFKAEMDAATRNSERRFLELTISYVERKSISSGERFNQSMSELKDLMGEDTQDYKEAKAAIDTVRTRVKQETLNAERRKWTASLDELENRSLGIPRRQNRRQGPTTNQNQPRSTNPRGFNPQNRMPNGRNQRRGRQGPGQGHANLIQGLLQLLGRK